VVFAYHACPGFTPAYQGDIRRLLKASEEESLTVVNNPHWGPVINKHTSHDAHLLRHPTAPGDSNTNCGHSVNGAIVLSLVYRGTHAEKSPNLAANATNKGAPSLNLLTHSVGIYDRNSGIHKTQSVLHPRSATALSRKTVLRGCTPDTAH
jgi:hypothetical protein